MTSYFDHFIIVSFFFNKISDYFFMLLFLLVIYFVLFINMKIIPNKFQLILENIYNHWSDLINQNMNSNSEFFVFSFFSLFLLLMGVNLFGFFLFSLPITTHLSVTFGLSMSFWLGIVFFGAKSFGFNYFSMFMPLGSPMLMSPLLVMMEFASYFSSPMALGMRLAANLTAGHMLLSMLSDFGCKILLNSFTFVNMFPFMMMMFMVVLEIAVLVIQAYVFCLLLVIYLKDSLILH